MSKRTRWITFSIRDLFWLILLVAVVCCWYLEFAEWTAERNRLLEQQDSLRIQLAFATTAQKEDAEQLRRVQTNIEYLREKIRFLSALALPVADQHVTSLREKNRALADENKSLKLELATLRRSTATALNDQ